MFYFKTSFCLKVCSENKLFQLKKLKVMGGKSLSYKLILFCRDLNKLIVTSYNFLIFKLIFEI